MSLEASFDIANWVVPVGKFQRLVLVPGYGGPGVP